MYFVSCVVIRVYKSDLGVMRGDRSKCFGLSLLVGARKSSR